MTNRAIATALSLLLLAVGLSTPATALTRGQGMEVSDWRRLPIDIAMDKETKEIVDEKELTTQIELRLRKYGINPFYDADLRVNDYGSGKLLISVSNNGSAFAISMEFIRYAVYYSELFNVVSTWRDFKFGQYGLFGRKTLLTDEGNKALDGFINTYLKANQK